MQDRWWLLRPSNSVVVSQTTLLDLDRLSKQYAFVSNAAAERAQADGMIHHSIHHIPVSRREWVDRPLPTMLCAVRSALLSDLIASGRSFDANKAMCKPDTNTARQRILEAA